MQVAVPSSDITTGAWTDIGSSPHYECLNESVASDGDYVQLNNQTANTFEVKLSAVDDPLSNVNHVVTSRVRKLGTGTISLTGYLMQGSTQIATWSISLSSSFTNTTYTLSSSEADAITDYGDLRTRYTGTCASATRYIAVSWVKLETPDMGVAETDSVTVDENVVVVVAEGALVDPDVNESDNVTTGENRVADIGIDMSGGSFVRVN